MKWPIRAAILAILGAGAGAQELLRVADVDADWVDDVVVSTIVPGHELFALSATRGPIVWTHEPDRAHRGIAMLGTEPRLARAHDLDRDGRADVVAAWICAESIAASEHVLVAIHAVSDGRTLITRVLPALRGRADNCTIASAGDTDGDGFDDLLLVRWPQHRWRGRVDVLCGRTLRTLACTEDSALGSDVRGVGDVDGDGCADFTTAVEREDGTEGRTLDVRSGLDAARIHHGPRDAVSLSAVPATGACSPTIVSVMRDADERGFVRTRDARTGSGRDVRIDDYDRWILGPATASTFTDFDSDGRGDFLLAMPRLGRPRAHDRDESEVGSVRILSADGVVLREWIGEAQFLQLGTTVVTAGDVDRDGFDDVWAVQTRQMATPELLLLSGRTGACLRRHRVTTW